MRQLKLKRKPDFFEEQSSHQFMLLGLTMGAGLGIVIGLPAGILSLGLALGTTIGMTIGHMIDSNQKAQLQLSTIKRDKRK